MQPDQPLGTVAIKLAATMLREQGFLILRGVVDSGTVAALDEDLARPFAKTPFSQGGFYGPRTKRFGRLLTRSRQSASFVSNPILGISQTILEPFCDTMQLNLTQGLAVHPDTPVQQPHRDQDMWGGETGRIEYLVNVMWPFTDYTAENAATLLWPSSHGAEGLAVDMQGDPVTAEMAPATP